MEETGDNIGSGGKPKGDKIRIRIQRVEGISKKVKELEKEDKQKSIEIRTKCNKLRKHICNKR